MILRKFVPGLLILALTCILVMGLVGEAVADLWPDDYDWPRDLGGQTIRLNTRWPTVTPLGLRHEYDWYDPDSRLEAHIETVEEWFNIDVEFVEPIIHEGQAAQQIAERFIVGEIDFEYTNIVRHDLPDLVAEGFARPLDDIYVDDYLDYIPERFRFFVRPPLSAERMFGTPWMFESMGYSKELAGLWWNKNLFEEAGLPTPYELWDEDEWTFDALETLAQELTMDTTGDGETDQWGISGLGGRWWNNLLVVNEGALTMEDEDGFMRATLTDPRTVWMLEWMVYMNNELEVVGGNIANATSAMDVHWMHAIRHGGWKDSLPPDHELGFIPFPQGPDAEHYRVATGNIWLGIIPITRQDAREVVEVVNALHLYKYPYIEPGEPVDRQHEIWEERFWDRWARYVYDRETVEFKRWMTPRVVHSDHLRAAEAVGWDDAIDAINVEGQSVAAAMAEIEPGVQTYLDEMYEQ